MDCVDFPCDCGFDYNCFFVKVSISVIIYIIWIMTPTIAIERVKSKVDFEIFRQILVEIKVIMTPRVIIL